MPTHRVDLAPGAVVNLATAGPGLVNGTKYIAQHRGDDGPIYLAELVAAM